MTRFEYAVLLAPAEKGGFVVTCRDLPQLMTQGEDAEDALVQASDAMDEVFAAYMKGGLQFPTPSEKQQGEHLVSPPADTLPQGGMVFNLATAKIRMRKKIQMSNFPHKTFEGAVYEFHHLAPFLSNVALNAQATEHVSLHVSYSIHCFTEEFDSANHLDHHRYKHENELRAFDVTRYRCSLQLPALIAAMLSGTVYRAKHKNYTYVAQISLGDQQQPYSIFFGLKNDASATVPTVRMYVQSAYLKPLVVSPSAQSWRFKSLAGQISGIFEVPKPKPKPQKKKAP
jgi:predicted RNase H-like HicB family nuclease